MFQTRIFAAWVFLATSLASWGGAADCNLNHVDDADEIATGATRDDDASGVPDECERGFLRGDANQDGVVSIADRIFIQRYHFVGGREPSCLDSADFDDDGQITLVDYVSLAISVAAQDAEDIPGPFPTAGEDPTADDIDCDSYFVEAAPETEDIVEIGEIDGAPGLEIDIPVRVVAGRKTEALELVIRYDPDLFEPIKVDFDDTYHEERREICGPGSSGLAELTAIPEDRVFVVTLVGSFLPRECALPVGESIALRIHGLVPTGAPTGSFAELTLVRDDSRYGPFGLRTALVQIIDAISTGTLPRTVDGGIHIIDPDDRRFERGDANGDSSFDIADPMYVASYLFLGGDPLICPDAGAANDDGALDISDALAAVRHLFFGSPLGNPPLGVCRIDETADDLPICARSDC